MQICKPFLNCKITDITQGFNNDHQAVDFKVPYGTFLLAPCNAKVAKVVKAEKIDDSNIEMQRGCGLLMISTENPNWRFAMWHCLPVFPVKEGDVVLKGRPVAQAGNTGLVQGWDGKEITTYTVEERLRELKEKGYGTKGVHLHYSCGYGDGTAENTINKDLSKLIDWSYKPSFDLKLAVKQVLVNILLLTSAKLS